MACYDVPQCGLLFRIDDMPRFVEILEPLSPLDVDDIFGEDAIVVCKYVRNRRTNDQWIIISHDREDIATERVWYNQTASMFFRRRLYGDVLFIPENAFDAHDFVALNHFLFQIANG